MDMGRNVSRSGASTPVGKNDITKAWKIQGSQSLKPKPFKEPTSIKLFELTPSRFFELAAAGALSFSLKFSKSQCHFAQAGIFKPCNGGGEQPATPRCQENFRAGRL
jgi:hypothetical protein